MLQTGRPRNQGSFSGKWKRFFSSLEYPDRLASLPNILHSGYRGAAPYRRIKWPKHKAISDLQCSLEGKMVWSYTSIPCFAFMVHCLTAHRGCDVRYICRILTVLDERVCFKADYYFFLRSSKLSPQYQAWVVIQQNHILCGIIHSKYCWITPQHTNKVWPLWPTLLPFSSHWFRMQICSLVRRRQSVAMETIGCHWRGGEYFDVTSHGWSPGTNKMAE